MVANVTRSRTSQVQIAQDVFFTYWKALIQAILC